MESVVPTTVVTAFSLELVVITIWFGVTPNQTIEKLVTKCYEPLDVATTYDTLSKLERYWWRPRATDSPTRTCALLASTHSMALMAKTRGESQISRSSTWISCFHFHFFSP